MADLTIPERCGYDHLGAWRVRCGGCGWPILWCWHVGVGGQRCRNCQPQLDTRTHDDLFEHPAETRMIIGVVCLDG